MKSNVKKLKLNLKLKILFEMYTEVIISYAIIILGIFFIGFIFNKSLESLFMLISYFIFRKSFPKELHRKSTIDCIKLSLFIFFIAISTVLPVRLSYIFSIISGMLICYITYRIQDYLDYIVIPKSRESKRNKVIKKLGKDNLDEESIENFCVTLGMPELSETVYLFINNKLEDTAEILGVQESTITRRINKFLKG